MKNMNWKATKRQSAHMGLIDIDPYCLKMISYSTNYENETHFPENLNLDNMDI